MEWVCRFGEVGCGIEEVFAFAGFAAAGITIIAAVVFALAYMRASRFSKPVVEALQSFADESRSKIESLEKQNAGQANELSMLREMVTQAAAVERFRIEAKMDHEGISHALDKISDNLGITTRILLAMAKQLGIDVRKDDLD